MDLATGIQKAIHYIEDNLLSDLEVDGIAANAHVSAFHFQRIFHILSGLTLGEYIRNRRLSLAAVDLQSSDLKIIDIAMKYGYETPESFSRAFTRFHGILPSAAKEQGASIKSFSPLSIKVLLKGGSVLVYRIEEMKGFRVIGKAVRHNEGDGVPAKLWKDCHADGTMAEYTKYSTSPDKEHLGLMFANDGSSEESFIYIVGTIYDRETVPDGYVFRDIPARTWIKFKCQDLTERHAEADIWQKIYSEFFPTSEYMPVEHQMEVYPIGDGSYPDEISEIWIDIKKKTDV